MSSVLIRTYLLILLIFETIFLIIAIKSKNKKVFKIFNGLFFSFLISIIFYCTYFLSEIYTYDTGEFLEINELIISAIFCIINFIIGFIGLITQKIYKQKNK